MEIGTGYETSNVVHYKPQSNNDLSQESIDILPSTRRMCVHVLWVGVSVCLLCLSVCVCVCFCCVFVSVCVGGGVF